METSQHLVMLIIKTKRSNLSLSRSSDATPRDKRERRASYELFLNRRTRNCLKLGVSTELTTPEDPICPIMEPGKE